MSTENSFWTFFDWSQLDWSVVLTTFELAFWVTFILIIVSTPISWWLASGNSKARKLVSVIVALPLVLPPTVIGFYLLLLLSPSGWIGQLTDAIGLGSLAFSFSGLVIASCVYSLPFVVQPLYNAFLRVDRELLDSAATLRASPMDRFFSLVLPLAKQGYIGAAILGFAHTLGEFGVVLMIGGNIPGKTQVIATQIYDQVESLNYASAHQLSAFVLVVAFVTLGLLAILNRGQPIQRRIH